MDRIGFVVAEQELGSGYVEETVEPVINGESLVDMLGQAERKWPAYAGFPPHSLFAALRAALRRGSGADVASRESAYAALGPYRFSRQAYESALAEPTHAVSHPSR